MAVDSGQRISGIALAVLSVLLSGCPSETRERDAEGAIRSGDSKVASDPQQLLRLTRDQMTSGDFESASSSIRELLLLDPDNPEATLLAAQIAGERGDVVQAIELAESIELASRFGVGAVELRVKYLVQLRRFNEAADAIVEAIETLSGNAQWDRFAWEILNRVGRRQEASWFGVELCKAGLADEQVLVSLLRRNDSFPCVVNEDQDPSEFFEVGHGMARWYFTTRDYRKAIEELDEQFESEFESAAANALYGRLLTETQQSEQFVDWYSQADEDLEPFSDYWAALGTYFLDQRDYESSARCLMEAIYRDPTDDLTAHRLARVFYSLGRDNDGAQFNDRAVSVVQSEMDAEKFLQGKATQTLYLSTRERLLTLGRPFEVIGWSLLVTPSSAAQQRAVLKQKLLELNRDPKTMAMASEIAWIGIDPSQFPVAAALESLARQGNLRSSNRRDHSRQRVELLASPRFVDVAAEVGLKFRWHQDVEVNLASIPIHEFMGGGIAVIGYDLDGWPDAYLAQGSGDPPTDQCTRTSKLFRNVAAVFRSVTKPSGTRDFNYSTGLAAGDVNQDGFPDLFLGSIGSNRLLINNGDGTFRDATESLGEIADRFTSSLAIADINGDDLPDLYEAVYLEMEGAFVLPEVDAQGNEKVPAPSDFYAQSDRWFQSDGSGGFSVRNIDSEIAEPGSALGIVVTDFDGDRNNEVFVANDTRPNHFVECDPQDRLQDSAHALGLANGFGGSSYACMGIAVADFDRNQTIDLHVTNFSKESANLFLQDPDGGFTDKATRFGVDQLSRPYVGFGTKAIDFDRNGWVDLFVTNGHVFDQRRFGREFQMPPQLLANLGNRFEQIDVQDPSGYWSAKHLGRAVSLIDFDRDSQIDVLVGHFERPVALLRNETFGRADASVESSKPHWIQFELVGTESERDAVGARVVVTVDATQTVTTVTAGDGYLSSDEPVIEFGIGRSDRIDRVEVSWPSGKNQVFDVPPVDARYLIVEGHENLFPRTLIGAGQ